MYKFEVGDTATWAPVGTVRICQRWHLEEGKLIKDGEASSFSLPRNLYIVVPGDNYEAQIVAEEVLKKCCPHCGREMP